jgi:hypothetical protein
MLMITLFQRIPHARNKHGARISITMPKVIIHKHKKAPEDLWINVTVRLPPRIRDLAAQLDLNQSAICRDAITRAVMIEQRNRRKAQEIKQNERKEEGFNPLPCEVTTLIDAPMANKRIDNNAAAPVDSADRREVVTQ